jgi:hypothetical protein
VAPGAAASDRRFSRIKIMASSAARVQIDQWRAVMQAFGHRVGSQSATSPGKLIKAASARHARRRKKPAS